MTLPSRDLERASYRRACCHSETWSTLDGRDTRSEQLTLGGRGLLAADQAVTRQAAVSHFAHSPATSVAAHRFTHVPFERRSNPSPCSRQTQREPPPTCGGGSIDGDSGSAEPDYFVQRVVGRVHGPQSSTPPHPSGAKPHWALSASHVVGAHSGGGGGSPTHAPRSNNMYRSTFS